MSGCRWGSTGRGWPTASSCPTALLWWRPSAGTFASGELSTGPPRWGGTWLLLNVEHIQSTVRSAIEHLLSECSCTAPSIPRHSCNRGKILSPCRPDHYFKAGMEADQSVNSGYFKLVADREHCHPGSWEQHKIGGCHPRCAYVTVCCCCHSSALPALMWLNGSEGRAPLNQPRPPTAHLPLCRGRRCLSPRPVYPSGLPNPGTGTSALLFTLGPAALTPPWRTCSQSPRLEAHRTAHLLRCAPGAGADRVG